MTIFMVHNYEVYYEFAKFMGEIMQNVADQGQLHCLSTTSYVSISRYLNAKV